MMYKRRAEGESLRVRVAVGELRKDETSGERWPLHKESRWCRVGDDRLKKRAVKRLARVARVLKPGDANTIADDLNSVKALQIIKRHGHHRRGSHTIEHHFCGSARWWRCAGTQLHLRTRVDLHPKLAHEH